MSQSQATSPPEAWPGSLADPLLASVLRTAPPEHLQQLLTWAIKAYASRAMALESGEGGDGLLAPVRPDEVSATEALILIDALLDAVHLNLFEVGMWQHIGRFAVGEPPTE